MLHLIIKGTEAQAWTAGQVRGVVLQNVRAAKVEDALVLAETEESERERVAAWLGEAGVAPFPAGTLLHYRSEELFQVEGTDCAVNDPLGRAERFVHQVRAEDKAAAIAKAKADRMERLNRHHVVVDAAFPVWG